VCAGWIQAGGVLRLRGESLTNIHHRFRLVKGIPSYNLDGLREAGERHHDLNGGNPDVSEKAAEHSKETKVRYYKKVSYEEAQESFSRHHPAFVEGW